MWFPDQNFGSKNKKNRTAAKFLLENIAVQIDLKLYKAFLRMRPVFWTKWRYQKCSSWYRMIEFVLLSANFSLYIKQSWEAILWLFPIPLQNRWDPPPWWAALMSISFHQKKESFHVESYTQWSRWIFCCKLVWIW